MQLEADIEVLSNKIMKEEELRRALEKKLIEKSFELEKAIQVKFIFTLDLF
jgi:hypothetical protein